MEKIVGKTILFRIKNKRFRLLSMQVECAHVIEKSPSFKYVHLVLADGDLLTEGGKIYHEKRWYPIDAIEVLEVLERPYLGSEIM